MRKTLKIVLFTLVMIELSMFEIKEVKYVMEEKTNKTLEAAVISKEYNENFYNDYLQIDYQEKEDFIKEINIFLEKKYTADEINNIYLSFKPTNIRKLLDKNYLNLSDFFNIRNFDADNYPRYVSWNKDNIDLQTIVTYVNIGLDKDFYSFYDELNNTDSYTILINKYHRLSASYTPLDLISLSFDEKYKLRAAVVDGLEKLLDTAQKDGHYIAPYSAYRSYEYQEKLYNSYVQKDGKAAADEYSARPGHSEHQSGLAVDITSIGNVNELSERDFNWIAQNAYKYGFIVRYPKDKTAITGFREEPWHLRYVGIEVATAIQKTNLTFEEYYDLFIKD